MAEKLLTLIQDTTGDEVYPNVKEDNLPPSVREQLQKIDTKQDKLTETQMFAVNSGITQHRVGIYDAYDNQIKGKQDKITASTVNPFVKTVDGTGIDLYQITLDANGNLLRGPVVDQIPSDSWIQGELDKKQDNLTTNQLSAVNSGITQTKVATYDGYNTTISKLDVDLSNTINELNHKQDVLESGTNIKTINGQSILGSGDLPISGGGGGSSYIPLEFKNADIRSGIMLTKEQYDTLINAIIDNEPIIAYISFYDSNNILISKIPLIPTIYNSAMNQTCGAYFIADSETQQYNAFVWILLSITQEGTTSYMIFGSSVLYFLEYGAGLQFDAVNNKLQFSMSSSESSLSGYKIRVDTINGNPVIHDDFTTSRNYDLGKSINLFGNHSILVPNSSTDTNINLYNHFIKITGTKDTTQVRARFTIQSSNNLVVDTPEKLVTLLGNEFELGCNGIYGNYSIIGLKKTADGTLNIIYNNGGAESLQSIAGLTNVTFKDTVTTI